MLKDWRLPGSGSLHRDASVCGAQSSRASIESPLRVRAQQKQQEVSYEFRDYS